VSSERITLTKLDAARRQLDTGLLLWFQDGDPVSIHTLASASHEIIDALYKAKKREGLLYGHPRVRKEYRRMWATRLKEAFNFFKHGRHDLGASLSFSPSLNETIFLFSTQALQEVGEKLTDIEQAFTHWYATHHPELLLPEAAEFYRIIGTDDLRILEKTQFLDYFLAASRS
jgi:hypothetical protein